MIIDLILDRRDGCGYDPALFAFDVNDYNNIFHDAAGILAALVTKDENKVRAALCDYVRSEGCDPEICDYINSVYWLPAWWDMD